MDVAVCDGGGECSEFLDVLDGDEGYTADESGFVEIGVGEDDPFVALAAGVMADAQNATNPLDIAV